MGVLRLLYIGDIVGSSGREAIARELPLLRKAKPVDFIVANAENAAHGFGLTPSIAKELFDMGIQVLTGGNHTFDKKEVVEVFAQYPGRVVRPANYPARTPGPGSTLYPGPQGLQIGIINVMGRVFMDPLDCPFEAFDREYSQIQTQTKIILLDIHAEATSEKYAIGYYSDGKVSACVGSHPHVQRADEIIFAKGTGYLSDAGMTGPTDSIIGMKKEIILQRFLEKRPVRMEVSENRGMLQGAIFEIDTETGRCLKVERVRRGA